MPTDLSRRAGAQVLIDRYRCPEDSPTFVVSGQPRTDQGFFRFGDSAICYGQCASGETQKSSSGQLYDALDAVIVDESGIHLPFDAAQVIDNLRAERYLKTPSGLNTLPGSKLLRNAYYRLRPLMSVSIRKHLQRIYFRGWQRIPFPEWPVDFTVEHIYEELLRLALIARHGKPMPFIWFWPKGALSCTLVTHDVETRHGVDWCPRLMDLNDSFGIKASFQVVPEERYPVHESFLAQIRSRGFEVNVHDLNHDGKLFQNKDEFLRRAALINRYVETFGAAGFRSAVMYRNTDWYHALDVLYDMSVPNVSHLDPQQGGCCTVMPFFVGNIVELPVTMTQDYSLFHILDQYSADLWYEQIRRIRRKNGLISVIVHPDYISKQKACQVYKDLLTHLAELRSAGQTWIALPKEVAQWWRQRSQLTLVQCGESWRIEGEGKERASIAYAVLDGGSVRYQLAPQA
jgi:hypothetical protein